MRDILLRSIGDHAVKRAPGAFLYLTLFCLPCTAVAATLLGDAFDAVGRFRYSVHGESVGIATVDWRKGDGIVIYDTANQPDPSLLEEFDLYMGVIPGEKFCTGGYNPAPPESGCITSLRSVFDVYESEFGWEFVWSYENIATDDTFIGIYPRIMDIQDLDWVDIPGGGEITGVEIIQQDFSTTSPVVTAHGVSITSNTYLVLTAGEKIENRYRFITPYATVPVPGAIWLFGTALGMLGWMRRETVYPLS